jgi:hypothetical protein
MRTVNFWVKKGRARGAIESIVVSCSPSAFSFILFLSFFFFFFSISGVSLVEENGRRRRGDDSAHIIIRQGDLNSSFTRESRRQEEEEEEEEEGATVPWRVLSKAGIFERNKKKKKKKKRRKTQIQNGRSGHGVDDGRSDNDVIAKCLSRYYDNRRWSNSNRQLFFPAKLSASCRVSNGKRNENFLDVSASVSVCKRNERLTRVTRTSRSRFRRCW